MTGKKKSQLSRSKNSVYLEKVWEGALRVPEAVHPLTTQALPLRRRPFSIKDPFEEPPSSIDVVTTLMAGEKVNDKDGLV